MNLFLFLYKLDKFYENIYYDYEIDYDIILLSY